MPASERMLIPYNNRRRQNLDRTEPDHGSDHESDHGSDRGSDHGPDHRKNIEKKMKKFKFKIQNFAEQITLE